MEIKTRGLDIDRRFATFDLGGTEVAVVSAPCVPNAASGLTDAEAEVAALVAAGLSNAEIGASRGTSKNTVAHQVGAILVKLGLGARREVARTFIGRGR